MEKDYQRNALNIANSNGIQLTINTYLHEKKLFVNYMIDLKLYSSYFQNLVDVIDAKINKYL